jgi:hypothetical protein
MLGIPEKGFNSVRDTILGYLEKGKFVIGTRYLDT